MDFNRGIDPKESLRIGRIWKALKIEGIEICLMNPADTNKIYYPYREVFTGQDLHNILLSLQNKKAPWEVVMARNNQWLSSINKEANLIFRMVFIKKLDFMVSGFNKESRESRINYRRIQGTDIVYEGVLYNMPKLTK